MQRCVLIGALGLLLTAGACKQESRTDRATDSTATSAPTDTPTGPAPLTDRLTALGLTTDSDWRGISLGDPLTKVKATETGERFEEDAQHVGYAVEFPNLESADFLYDYANGTVTGIRVDLYLNTKEAVAAYQTDLSAYLTGRYGNAQAENGTTVWTAPAGKRVSLKDVSKGKDFGLKLRIEQPGNGATTASAR